MYAVIQTGGKQYFVTVGQTLKVEKLEQAVGEEISIETFLFTDENGSALKLGLPTVVGAKVTAKVVEQGRADKISVIKFKPKVRYRRNVGHRQPFTAIEINAIV